MSRAARKEVRRLIAQIEAAGGSVVRARSGHWKVYVNDRLVTSIPNTPSDWRGLMNTRALLRRAGIEIPRSTP